MEFLKDMFKFEADTGNNGGSNPSEGDTFNKEGESGADSSNTEKTIPYDRFKEVNDNYKDVKKQLDDLLKQRDQEKEEAKKKQGEFESLYNDIKGKYDPLSEQFEQYKETFQTILENELSDVPQDYKDLIPQGNEVEQLKWVQNAKQKGLFKKDNPESFGNNGNNPDTNEGKPKRGFLKDLSRF
ncbi:hypothetical protein [Gracilibacillus saliphilus]|uniref:hypothetical protein n=1 Tax=Gracilibacillus saliphilus TaxID=543890 RepID=UPI0013D51729|nr:hypothetical protein [Gracilibacillus saliphilus]